MVPNQSGQANFGQK